MPDLPPLPDRLKAGIERVIRAVMGARIDFMVPHAATVKAQHADGSVDLQFDDPRLPGGNTGGVNSIPIHTGVPGVTFTISVGARVQVVFVEGDPSKPRVTEWETASVQETVLTSSAIKLGGPGASQALVLGNLYATHLGQLSAALTALSSAMTPLLLPPAVAAAKAALAQAITATNNLAGDISAQNTTL